MEELRNKCLRAIVGAYKATPVEVLQAETLKPPMKEHLNQLQANARLRLKTSGQAAFIRKQRKKLETKCATAIEEWNVYQARQEAEKPNGRSLL